MIAVTSATHTHRIRLPSRYELERWIADGGMASVWRAHDRVLGRTVAIKLLSEPIAHQSGAVARFKREARAAAALSGHPHVVSIFDIGELETDDSILASAGRPFIVMEYLSGGNVADALRRGPVDPAQALRWITQAASAIDHAHASGIVHRDIKPANLLLDRGLSLHVGDFGIARLTSDETLSGSEQLLGTAAYISPEQARGARATPASDRYSLAVVAFELLAGQRPFAASPLSAQLRQHVETAPPAASKRNPALPPALDGVLARGMAKQPEQRWNSATAFASALEAACTGTRRRRAAFPPSRPAQRPRGAVPGAVLTGPMRRRSSASAPSPDTSATAVLPAAGAVAGRTLGRSLALAALGLVVAAIAAAAVLSSQSAPVRRAAGHSAAKPAVTRSTPRHASRPRSRPAAPARTTVAPVAPAPSPAQQLEARGHSLMTAGDFAAAIPVLRAAVQASAPPSLTYAYALFDLGRSLRLAGQPRAAVPVLWRRLQIPIETNVVRVELQFALQAIGLQEMHAGGRRGHGGAGAGRGHGSGHD